MDNLKVGDIVLTNVPNYPVLSGSVVRIVGVSQCGYRFYVDSFVSTFSPKELIKLTKAQIYLYQGE